MTQGPSALDAQRFFDSSLRALADPTPVGLQKSAMFHGATFDEGTSNIPLRSNTLATTSDRDSKNLALLSKLHLANAALNLLLVLCFTAHFWVTRWALLNAGGGVLDRTSIMLFVGIYAVILVMYGAIVVANVFASERLRSHRGYTSCLVVSAINLLTLPTGLLLGVFTIATLMRDSVRDRFDVER